MMATSTTAVVRFARCYRHGISRSFSSLDIVPSAHPVALIFDTETTGLVQFKTPATDPKQPSLLQLGMILVDTHDWTHRLKTNLLVQLDDGVSIDAKAQEIHGISPEHCERFGVPLQVASLLFQQACSRADIVVAHNLAFDRIVMDCALHRSGIQPPGTQSVLDGPGLQKVCTMDASIDILQLPGKYGKFKWPSLAEAYAHFSNGEKDIVGAHDALTDTEACLKVFQGLVRSGVFSLEEAKASHEKRTTLPSSISESIASFQSSAATEIDTNDIIVKMNEGQVFVSGQTFRHKEMLKSMGGKWRSDSKAWVFHVSLLKQVSDHLDSFKGRSSKPKGKKRILPSIKDPVPF